MSSFKVGVQLHPQQTSVDHLRSAWKKADATGVDSIWTWDHFFPLWGPRDGPHFEGWSLLAACAVDTSAAHIGVLVSSNSYRNPDLLADMARTVDHLSGGRCILGIGAGWFERDYEEYGYEFGTARSRLDALKAGVERIRARAARLNPPPLGPLPLLIGGGGERVTLRLVAQHADMWNSFGPPDVYARKNAVLDEWCAKTGRDPAAVERTVLLNGPREIKDVDDFLAAGAQHLILGRGHPFELQPVEDLLALAGE